jgi:hypothetical protein
VRPKLYIVFGTQLLFAFLRHHLIPSLFLHVPLYRSARKHWLYFLNNHCNIKVINQLKRSLGVIIDETQVPLKRTLGVIIDANQVPYDALTSELLGSFATYLSSVARNRCVYSNGLIAFKSADSYFSAIKAYYCVQLYTDKFTKGCHGYWTCLCLGI